MISIIKMPLLQDNYSYGVLDNKDFIVIDPANSIKILEYIEKNNLLLKAILITHHHADHTDGIEGLLNKNKVPVYSPNKEIKYTNKIIHDKEIINLGFISLEVIATPGHTLDHVVLHDKKNDILFSGDTLFRLGCGRIFEGTNKEMFASLQKIKALNNKTTVYCGHEYTKANLNFLLSIFTKNKSLLAEKERIDLQIRKTGTSVPFNLGEEKQVNPFLNPDLHYLREFKSNKNLSNFKLFSYLRDLKNSF